MLRVTFILGLPGSGKTMLARSLMTEQSTLIDDFNQHLDAVAAFLTAPTPHLIITDPQACLSSPDRVRDVLEGMLGRCIIEFIPFQNDPDRAWYNVRDRNDGRVILRDTIELYAKQYCPSLWGVPIPVYYSAC